MMPRTASLRFFALFEAASGLIVISLAITYILTVYAALERKRAVAVSLYHQAGEGADVAGFIAHHFVEGRFYGLRDALRTVTRDLQGLHESHIDHPVIHYFHPVEVYKGTPRVLFLLLETCAVIRAALDREENSDLRNYPEVRTLDAGVRHVLAQLVDSLDLERRDTAAPPDRAGGGGDAAALAPPLRADAHAPPRGGHRHPPRHGVGLGGVSLAARGVGVEAAPPRAPPRLRLGRGHRRPRPRRRLRRGEGRAARRSVE